MLLVISILPFVPIVRFPLFDSGEGVHLVGQDTGIDIFELLWREDERTAEEDRALLPEDPPRLIVIADNHLRGESQGSIPFLYLALIAALPACRGARLIA